MSHRVHVRGAAHLRRGAVALLPLVLAIAAAPVSAQGLPEPSEAPEPTADPTSAADDTGGVPADYDPDVEDARPVFLVTEIVVEEGVGISAEGARDALAGRFGRLKDKLDVRSLSEVKATLSQQGLNQLLGGEGEGLHKLSSYVDADRVVFGRIYKVGDVTEVSVRVFHVRDAAMELAMSRRLKAGANEALLLSVVDALADRLAVWALNTYGDATPSSGFAAMKNKKVGGKKEAPEVVAAAPSSPWTFMGVGGGALAGVGLGVVGAGAALAVNNPQHDPLVPGIVMGVGAATFLGGTVLVIVDGIE